MNLRNVCFSLAVLLAAFPTLAQWQWLDSDGRKVFSDRGPPADVPEKNILKRPGAGSRASAEPAAAAAASAPVAEAPKPSGVDKTLEAKKKAAADAEAAKQKEGDAVIARLKTENCQRARQAKAGLDSGVRMARLNNKGEREVMDDAARAEEMKRIQATIAADCN